MPLPHKMLIHKCLCFFAYRKNAYPFLDTRTLLDFENLFQLALSQKFVIIRTFPGKFVPIGTIP